MSLNPNLIVICDWPADAADITPEHVRLLTETGDVKGVIHDLVRLTQHPHLTTSPEAKAHARANAAI